MTVNVAFARLVPLAVLFLSSITTTTMADGVPSEVQRAVEGDLGDCATRSPELLRNATTVVPHFTPTGDAYIVEYAKMYDGCPSIVDKFQMASGGAIAKIFVVDGVRARVVWDDPIFYAKARKRAIELGLHGSFCGRVGAAGCKLLLTWKNNRLSTRQLN